MEDKSPICAPVRPAVLPAEGAAVLADMECDLIDEDEIEPRWLSTMADSPYPGPVRETVKSLLQSFTREERAIHGLA